MKKLFFVLLILSTQIFSQTNGLVMTSKVITWTDSLKFTTDSVGVGEEDSIKIFKINFRADCFRVYLDANANSPVDSISIELGARVYTDAGVCTDTTWGSAIAVKDSAWNTLNTLVNKSTGKDYSSYTMPPIDLIRVTLLNDRATLLTRKVRVTLQGSKD